MRIVVSENTASSFTSLFPKVIKLKFYVCKLQEIMLQCACCQRLVLLLRTINLEQANGNHEEQIDQMQGSQNITVR